MYNQKPIKKCLTCGKPYPKHDKYSKSQWVSSKYCSYKCHAQAKRNQALKKPKRKKICKYCNSIFYRDKGESDIQWQAMKFCSSACAGNSRRKHASSKDKGAAYRRRLGMAVRGSPEHLESLSRLTKLAMQRADVQEKIRQPRSAMSLERRMQMSEARKGKMPANLGDASGKFSNVKRGHYDINGTTIYFRSGWEANYALVLDMLIDHEEIIKWEFEPDTFMFEQIKLGTRSYTPDFKVFNNNGSHEYHEVKGYMDSRSKTKIKRFAKYYPNEKLVLIDKDQYLTMKKQVGKLLNFY